MAALVCKALLLAIFAQPAAAFQRNLERSSTHVGHHGFDGFRFHHLHKNTSHFQERMQSWLQMIKPKPNGSKDADPSAEGSEAVIEQLGVTSNSSSDLNDVFTALLAAIALVVVYLGAFLWLVRAEPMVYQYNSMKGSAPQPRESWYGLFMKIDQVQECAGLDGAMFVEFCNLGMKMTACLGIPVFVVLAPMYYVVSDQCMEGQTLEELGESLLWRLSISGVSCSSRFYWVLAAVVWVVVFITMQLINRAQKDFVARRILWLQDRTKPQATTLMVSNIPVEYRSDQALTQYFNKLFPDGDVERVYVVKHLSKLTALLSEFDNADQRLHEALYMWQREDCDEERRPTVPLIREGSIKFSQVDSINHYKAIGKELLEKIEQERAKVKAEIEADDRFIYGSVAFVTFKGSRNSEMLLRMRLEPERDTFTMGYPPSPSDVKYSDLLRGPLQRQVYHIVGYFLIFSLFLLFFPIIGALSSFMNLESLESISFVKYILEHLPWLQSMIESVLSTLALSLFMGFLPTLLKGIIDSYFHLGTDRASQFYLQQWYFWFLVTFVLLITALGSSIWQKISEVVANPQSILATLASTLPNTSTFYIDYTIYQWSTTFLTITRYTEFLKFVGLQALCTKERAKERTEPEDQDYNGVGSRSARLTLILVMGLVFSVISPLMLIATFLFFFICRFVYTYLVVFAETRKPDMGGQFWALSLRQVGLCVPLFIVTMAGCLWGKTSSGIGPGTMALSSILLWWHQYSDFYELLWETLPFSAVAEVQDKNYKMEDNDYVQPELGRVLCLRETIDGVQVSKVGEGAKQVGQASSTENE